MHIWLIPSQLLFLPNCYLVKSEIKQHNSTYHSAHNTVAPQHTHMYMQHNE